MLTANLVFISWFLQIYWLALTIIFVRLSYVCNRNESQRERIKTGNLCRLFPRPVSMTLLYGTNKGKCKASRCGQTAVDSRPNTLHNGSQIIGGRPAPARSKYILHCIAFFPNQHSPPPGVVLWWSSAPWTVAHYGGSKIASLVDRELEPITLSGFR